MPPHVNVSIYWAYSPLTLTCDERHLYTKYMVRGRGLPVSKDSEITLSLSFPTCTMRPFLCDSERRLHVERMKAFLRTLPAPGYCASM